MYLTNMLIIKETVVGQEGAYMELTILSTPFL